MSYFIGGSTRLGKEISSKGQVISIGNSINPKNFKEIGIRNY
jgi:hypothetical protein